MNDIRKHGTYRPRLAKLVAENSVTNIRKTTKDAFSIYDGDNSDAGKAVTAISKLKGVGPATASLFLSCYDPIKVPFFSDELFRYLHWSDIKARGWDRKISYTMKEYQSLLDKTKALRERLEKESGQIVKAIDLEKMAYEIAKSAQTAVKRGNGDEEEGNKALRPPSPKRRRKPTPEPSQDPVDVCRRKGPRGSPTYDEMGFELDYEKIAKCSGPPRRLGKRAMERLEKSQKEDERKAFLMGQPEVKHALKDAWDDRVARDLGIAFHEVGIEEYEQWYERGFRVKRDEFDNISNEDRKRLDKLTVGSALRKGSKR